MLLNKHCRDEPLSAECLLPLLLFVEVHATMDTEAFFKKHRPVFIPQGEVHVEALGNPLQTALSLSSCYYFTDIAAAQVRSLERQQASGSPSGMSAAVVSLPPEPAAAATAAGLLPELENAESMPLAAGRGGTKEEDSRMRERSLEKRCSGGEGENCFFAEVEDRSSSSNGRSDSSANNSGSARGTSSGSLRSGGGQQQQETSCEEEVSAEEEVETADGDSTATEGETDADSELYYSEESEDDREHEIEEIEEEEEEEEEEYDKEVSRRSVVFCDAFAGLEGGNLGGECEGIEQQSQQARTPAAEPSAVAAPTRERGKRKFACTSCEGSDGVIVVHEKRGRKTDEDEEGFGLQSKRPADAEGTSEHRQSSRRARRGTVHTGPEPLLERQNSPAAVSSRVLHSPGCKRRNSRGARDAGVGVRVFSSSSSSMQWQTSRHTDFYNSNATGQQQCSSSSTAESSSAMLGSSSKRRNRSRSLGGLRIKVRRRVSEAETYTVRSSSCSSISSSSRAAPAVIAGSREHFSREVESPAAAAAATRQVEAAEADPLTRLARRTEELLLMHSKRFMEEQQKC